MAAPLQLQLLGGVGEGEFRVYLQAAAVEMLNAVTMCYHVAIGLGGERQKLSRKCSKPLKNTPLPRCLTPLSGPGRRVLRAVRGTALSLVYGTMCTLTTSSSGADTLPCTIPQDRGPSKEKCKTLVFEVV